MPWLVTIMPSTGAVTNITHSERSEEDLRRTWDDDQNVSVFTDEQYREWFARREDE